MHNYISGQSLLNMIMSDKNLMLRKDVLLNL